MRKERRKFQMDRIDVRQAFVKHVVASCSDSHSLIIPPQFIYDFLEMMDVRRGNGRLCFISLDTVANWLGSTLKSLTRTLRRTRNPNMCEFLEGRDYIEVPLIKNGHEGHDYLISIDCFQKMCMRSNSPKAPFIREFFVRVLFLYQEFFEKRIGKNIDVFGFERVMKDLETKLPFEFKRELGVYAIEFQNCEGEDLVQIGHTANGPNGRYQFHKAKGINHRLTKWIPHPFPRALERKYTCY
jgi:hypothetical protein